MFYVVSIAAQPILGLEDCVTREYPPSKSYNMLKEAIKTNFSDVFKGLENLHIALKDDTLKEDDSSSLMSSHLPII